MNIAISQRVENLDKINERRDCLDQQWTVLLDKNGFIPVPVPNRLSNPEAWIDKLKISGIIFSGGNDLTELKDGTNPAPERDETEQRLIKYSIKKNIPVMGVCRGMQLLALFYGMRLKKIPGHVAVCHRLDIVREGYFIPEEVNSFHNYGIENKNIDSGIIVTSCSKDGYIESFACEEHRHYAVMWHPERKPENQEFIKLMNRIFRSENL